MQKVLSGKVNRQDQPLHLLSNGYGAFPEDHYFFPLENSKK